MLMYYVDESGTHDGAPACVLGSYLSPANAWASFELEWKACLTEYDIPHFHMTDYENRQAPFVGWSDDRRLALIERLVSIINRWTVGGVLVGIDLRHFYDVWVPSLTPGEREIADPYVICLLALMGQHQFYFDQLEQSEQSPVAFVLERNTKSAAQSLRFLSEAWRYEGTLHVPSMTYGSRDEFLPLQAADILAYEGFKELKNRWDGSGRPLRKLLSRLRENNRIIGGLLTLESLNDIMRNGRLLVRRT